MADEEMRAEYDFSAGVRGKYFERYQQGTNLVLVESELLSKFPSADAVNEGLRLLVKIANDDPEALKKAQQLLADTAA